VQALYGDLELKENWSAVKTKGRRGETVGKRGVDGQYLKTNSRKLNLD